MRSLLALLTALPATFAAPASTPEPSTLIANQWLVKLQDGASWADLQSAINDLKRLTGHSPGQLYNIGDFTGFSIRGLPGVPTALSDSKNNKIAWIEPDQIVTTSSLVTQLNAPYGLARISHRSRGSTSYLFDSSAGEGTYAYVIDTGIYTNHTDFEGRAVAGPNFAGTDESIVNGHGTHVAGTIGGKTFGVAKKTNLVGIKVLGGAEGRGSLSGVIAGLQWAVEDAKNNSRIDKSVANLSLGSGYSQMLNDAVRAAVGEGLFTTVAAGNDGKDANNTSPASTLEACTAGAIDSNDIRPDFSDFGEFVDVFAPGVGVQSAWITSPDASAFLSGTSMASPHVAGVGAYLLGLEYGNPGGVKLCSKIKKISTKKVVGNAGEGSRSRIAFNGGGSAVVKGLGARWSKREVA